MNPRFRLLLLLLLLGVALLHRADAATTPCSGLATGSPCGCHTTNPADTCAETGSVDTAQGLCVPLDAGSGSCALADAGSMTSGSTATTASGTSGDTGGVLVVPGSGATCCAACGGVRASGCAAGAYAIAADGGASETCVAFRAGSGAPHFAAGLVQADVGPCEVAVGSTSSLAAALAAFDGVALPLCEVTTAQDGSLARLRLVNAAGDELLFVECATLQVTPAGAGAERKRQSTVVPSSTGTPITTAAAAGDPHLTGPNGERYDFDGKANGIYALFTTPQWVLNMQLLAGGPKQRFINRLGLVFRNVTLAFDTFNFDARQRQAELNARLARTGARARVSPFTTTLELCDGQRITVSQRFTKGWLDRQGGVFVGAPDHNHHAGAGAAPAPSVFVTLYHLDVAVTVPGCHDAFGGALGQTYQCKYENERFRFSHADEEGFRVPAIFSPSGVFASENPCHSMDDYANRGRSPMTGGSMDATKPMGAI